MRTPGDKKVTASHHKSSTILNLSDADMKGLCHEDFADLVRFNPRHNVIFEHLKEGVPLIRQQKTNHGH